VLSVTFGLAFTQWISERRRVSGLPGYGAAGIGIVYGVMATGLGLAWWAVMRIVTKGLSGIGINFMAIANMVLSHCITVISVCLSVLLFFRLLRHREVPAQQPVERRGRALLIYTLFVWSWVLAIMQMMVPFIVTLGSSYGMDSSYELDTGSLVLITYTGSIGLALPAFLGGLAGLPSAMPYTQVARLWITSVLAILVCAVAMVAVAYALVRMASALGASSPGAGFTAFVTLVWFIVSIVGCWLLVRSIMRQQTPPSLDAVSLEREMAYQAE
jgi:hypothetical protein